MRLGFRIWSLIIGAYLFILRFIWVEFGPVWVIVPAVVILFFMLVPSLHARLAPRRKHREEGERYMQLGRLRNAEKEFAAAVEKAVRPASKAQVLLRLAESQRLQRKYDEAERSIRRAVEILTRAGKTPSAEYAGCLEHLGNVERDRGHLPEATRLFGEALDHLGRVRGVDPREVARKHFSVAMSEYQAGVPAAVVPRLERALEVCEAALGSDAEETAALLAALGAARVGAGDYQNAKALLERGMQAQKEIYAHNDPRVAESLYHLALACQQTGEIEKATDYFENVLSLREKHLDRNPKETAAVLVRLAEVHASAGRTSQAADHLRRAIYFLDTKENQGPELAHALDLMGTLYHGSGRYDEAAQYYDNSRRLWAAAPGGGDNAVRVARKQAAVLETLDRHEEADQLLALVAAEPPEPAGGGRPAGDAPLGPVTK